MNIKQNIPLIMGLAIPVLMILFIAVAIYLPGLFVKPQYDFLYATGNYPYYGERTDNELTRYDYTVRGDKLEKDVETVIDERPRSRNVEPPRFYVYRVESDVPRPVSNTSQELTFEEAQELSLSSNEQSPDGFTVTRGSRDGGLFPFFYFSDNGHNKMFIKSKNVSHEINVVSNSGRSGFKFIGWVLK